MAGSLDDDDDDATPIFALETRVRDAAKGAGRVTCADASDGVVVVGTDAGACVVHDLTKNAKSASSSWTVDCDPSSSELRRAAANAETSSSGRGRVVVTRVFVSPNAAHALACVARGGGGDDDDDDADVEIVHFQPSRKPTRGAPLASLRGKRVTAVAWSASRCDDVFARDVLLGTRDGSLFELTVDAADASRRDRSARRIFAVEDEDEDEGSGSTRASIVGLHATRDASGAHAVLVATRNALRRFAGGATLEATLNGGGGGGARLASRRRDGSGSGAENGADDDAAGVALHVSESANRLAWLTRDGVHTATLARLDGAAAGATRFFPLPRGFDPVAVAATPSHVVALSRDGSLLATCALTGAVAQRLTLTIDRDADAEDDREQPVGVALVASGGGGIGGGCLFAATTTAVTEATSTREGRRAWKILARRGDYDDALRACETAAQRGVVLVARAKACDDPMDAARWYAAAGNDAIAFETVCMGFLDAGADDALARYLTLMLDDVDGRGGGGRGREGREGHEGHDAALAKKLASWLLDLHVSRACAAEEEEEEDDGGAAAGELTTFLSAYAPRLDAAATKKLLTESGRLDDLAHYAEVIGAWDDVLSHRVRHGQYAKAFEAMRDANVPSDAKARCAPELFRRLPGEAVDCFLACGVDALPPARLVPAFKPFVGPGRTPGLTEKEDAERKAEATRYLQSVASPSVGGGGGAGPPRCEDRTVHDCLLRLLVDGHERDGSKALMRYVAGVGVGANGDALFDKELAARLCEEFGAFRAAIHVHCDGADHGSALELALEAGDLATAKLVAAKAAEMYHLGGGGDDDDEGRRGADDGLDENGEDAAAAARRRGKSLWLRIVDAEISKAGGDVDAAVARALALVHDAEGVLTVEDVLRVLPDFDAIDVAKPFVLAELKTRAGDIERSRARVDAAEATTRETTKAIDAMRARTIRLPARTPCAKCGRPISQLPWSFSFFAPNGVDPDEVAEGSPLSQYYVFPCGMGFHSTCLVEAALPWMLPDVRARCLELMSVVRRVPLTRELKRLRKTFRETGVLAVGRGANAAALSDDDKTYAVQRLEDILCCECPMCGDMMLRKVEAASAGE